MTQPEKIKSGGSGSSSADACGPAPTECTPGFGTWYFCTGVTRYDCVVEDQTWTDEDGVHGLISYYPACYP